MSTTGRAFLGAVAAVFALPIVIVLALAGGGEGTGSSGICGTPVNVGQVLPSGATLTQEMANNAGVVIRVGAQRGAGRQGQVIALATALVESGLYNLDHGDRDSLGLFQQRPSQGWGTPAQIMDPVYSSNKFFDKLLAIPNWRELDPGAAAQRVQISAYPDRYGQRMSDAVSILGGVSGNGNPTPTPTPGPGPTPSPGGGSANPGPTPNPQPGPAPTPPPSPGGGSATTATTASPGGEENGEVNLCGPATPGAPGTLADVAVPGGGTITVAAQLAEPLTRLLAAAHADGVALGGSGYRSAESQIELRKQHCGTSHYDIYEKPSGQCSPPTARPGRSMHEVGLAIDFTCNGGSVTRGNRCDTWLLAHAGSYGLHNLPSEAWHYSTTGT